MNTSSPPRSGGRPRSSAADRAILQTALRLLIEQGYDAMTMEGVAAAAGVGKTTIYRRYPGKRELVVAAVSALTEDIAPPPDSGNVQADLLAFLREMHAILRDNSGFSIMGTVLLKERDDPALIALFRRQVIGSRIELATSILRRGIARGEVRADFPLEVAVQMLAGAIIARHIVGQPEDDAWLRSVLDTLWRGLAPHPTVPTPNSHQKEPTL